MKLALLSMVAAGLTAMQAGAADPVTGRWASSDNVSSSGTAKAGARFFLDITVAGDGSFKGTWEEYVCFNYPGAYGIQIVSCQRSKKAQPAAGRLNAAAGSGEIDLKGMGKSSFTFKSAKTQKGQPQLDIALPKEWLKQGAPVLYETSLNPRR